MKFTSPCIAAVGLIAAASASETPMDATEAPFATGGEIGEGGITLDQVLDQYNEFAEEALNGLGTECEKSGTAAELEGKPKECVLALGQDLEKVLQDLSECKDVDESAMDNLLQVIMLGGAELTEEEADMLALNIMKNNFFKELKDVLTCFLGDDWVARLLAEAGGLVDTFFKGEEFDKEDWASIKTVITLALSAIDPPDDGSAGRRLDAVYSGARGLATKVFGTANTLAMSQMSFTDAVLFAGRSLTSPSRHLQNVEGFGLTGKCVGSEFKYIDMEYFIAALSGQTTESCPGCVFLEKSPTDADVSKAPDAVIIGFLVNNRQNIVKLSRNLEAFFAKMMGANIINQTPAAPFMCSENGKGPVPVLETMFLGQSTGCVNAMVGLEATVWEIIASLLVGADGLPTACEDVSKFLCGDSEPFLPLFNEGNMGSKHADFADMIKDLNSEGLSIARTQNIMTQLCVKQGLYDPSAPSAASETTVSWAVAGLAASVAAAMQL